MAGTKFTMGIDLYLKNRDTCESDQDCITKVVQLYTNRSLSWHNIGNQEDAFADADFVLTNLDPKNTKSLYRRSHCYKLKLQYALAVQDLELLVSLDSKNPQAKKDLAELKKELKKESTTKIKEVELPATKKEAEPVIEEVTKTPAEMPPKAKVVNRTKLLDQDLVDQAA